MQPRQRVPGRPQPKGPRLSINSSVAAAHDASSPYTGPPFSPSSGRTPKGEEDLSRDDPDDLFIRFSVSEIKNVQAKFRREADAKQEELRLMVGERYRDLLQASTSIMTISAASDRVVALLGEMKLACAQEEPTPQPIHAHAPRHAQDDGQLAIMQSLSAHIKLLLDAPEHLWHLLEQRKFLHAAWLFLLSRVVYRALVNADDTDEETIWQAKGIDVLEQFPLVQRQWDSISHFRSNISHKATHALREHKMAAEDTCATLVTLHLLESLPLNDTLSHLLAQRSKTLNALLTRSSATTPGAGTGETNGLGYGNSASTPTLEVPPDAVSDVSDILSSILDVLSSTVGVARAIFESDTLTSTTSLIERRLRDINAEASAEAAADPQSISTPGLLATLPSSTHLLTLPSSIQSYRPYVDLDSSSSHISPSILNAKVDEWFARGVEHVQARIGAWFGTLASITELWAVRAKVLEHIANAKGMLLDADRATLVGILDAACKTRAAAVWKLKFADLETALEHGVRAALDVLRADGANAQQDILPTTHLYSSQPPPSLSLVGANPVLALSSFQSYKAALKQKLSGRTPLLHGLLQTLERLAAEEKADLAVLEADHLAVEMRTMYDPVADGSCEHMLDSLTFALDAEEDKASQALHGLLFIGRICHELATSSTFVSDLNLTANSESLFRAKLAAVHSRTLTVWRSVTVQKAAALYQQQSSSATSPTSTVPLPSHPSGPLIEALTHIISATQRLGLSRKSLEEKEPTQAALQDLGHAIAAGISGSSRQWSVQTAQLLWDLEFLLRLSEAGDPHPAANGDAQQNGSSNPTHALQSQLVALIPKATRAQWSSHLEVTLQQQLARTQILLSPLLSLGAWESLALPSSTRTPLLPLGAPSSAQDARVEVGQSHVPRFVLLAS
ncbi:hypothetical protein EXIGLDRAFT_726529 [Exidia glandulosa HHB12029]|uniref:Conserved oligomeric Golgi complex subunit 1 n=1 Tax=Exidia glandulosa HHB12029 TaxID=1314781 RepID=A0A165MC72_EXIGL|nr:hypothetical protein EXIGLDRAFT_726529 [Exidia glandulosa HHB12029]